MILQTFERMIRRLRGSYEKKLPDATISAFWFEEAGAKIPDEAADWIIDWIKGQHSDRWPNHFQDVLVRAHQAWFAVHPDKRAFEPKRICDQPNCEDGLYWVQRHDDQLGYWANYALPCVCGRRRMGSVPRWTWDQVVKAGYRVKPEPELVRVQGRYNPREHGTVDEAVKRTADGMGW
jgi:hypothetical protein